MTLELRDELATRIAASLAASTLSPRQIAIRAYATADALLAERVLPTDLAVAGDEAMAEELELGPQGEEATSLVADPPHDPRWELEPRWSPADRALRDRRVVRFEAAGPGLVATRPGKIADEKANTG
jgi:hypothetical protein